MGSQRQLNYIQVSTLFIGAFSGFVLAAFVNNAVTDRLGMGKTVTTGAVLQACGYAALLAPPPFPLLPAIYAILIGFGMALLMVSSGSAFIETPALTELSLCPPDIFYYIS